MKKLLLACGGIACAISTTIFAFIPEGAYLSLKVDCLKSVDDAFFVLMCRLAIWVIVFFVCITLGLLRNSRTFGSNNYSLVIKYGDILKFKKCKKVINFDECFTCDIGENPAQIKPDSVCGQYLRSITVEDNSQNIQSLIDTCGLKPEKRKSKYNNLQCYKPGSIVPNGDYLLMAFTKLNQDGIGEMTYDEYRESLDHLWGEINKYYGSKSVCVPVLGSGRTLIDGRKLNTQEALDIMIESYKLFRRKIRTPHKLYIVCKRSNGFSLNKIGQTL